MMINHDDDGNITLMIAGEKEGRETGEENLSLNEEKEESYVCI
jgi:hypothetical protein